MKTNQYPLKKQIAKDLSQFGLNPADWIIQFKSGATAPRITIRHRQDSDLKMIGALKRKARSFKIENLSWDGQWA